MVSAWQFGLCSQDLLKVFSYITIASSLNSCHYNWLMKLIFKHRSQHNRRKPMLEYIIDSLKNIGIYFNAYGFLAYVAN